VTQYRYERERVDRSDLAAGRVLLGRPGATAFPVRLASELFQRALSHAGHERVVVHDPLCGGGYLLTVVGFLHATRIARLVASDVDPDSVALARRNLSLLTQAGIERRMEEIAELRARFGRASYDEGLEAARRLRLPVDVESEAFVADALDVSAPADIVLSDLPYGGLTAWRGASTSAFLATLARHDPGTIVALAAPKGEVLDAEGLERLERFGVGKRRLVVLRVG
jgi:23S rRNA G2445 N2-methylase RlmL